MDNHCGNSQNVNPEIIALQVMLFATQCVAPERPTPSTKGLILVDVLLAYGRVKILNLIRAMLKHKVLLLKGQPPSTKGLTW
jgi:hypothetical protein